MDAAPAAARYHAGMCGRFTLTTDPEKLARRFGIELPDEPLLPRFNIAPTQTVPVILNDEPQRASLLRWGLVPAWAPDPSIGNRLINARAETLAEKPSFRTALKKRRCLVLADGFYEWKKGPGGKTPMRITLADGSAFAFAGLWDVWRDANGQPLRTFTIITTTPNELMSGIHNRMPVILPPEGERLWLDDHAGPEAWQRLLVPCPAEALRSYAVSRRVNSPTNDDPAVIEPA